MPASDLESSGITAPSLSPPPLTNRNAGVRKLLQEPLVHFLLIGALLFLYFEWTGGNTNPASNRIVITAGQVEHLAAGFQKIWHRPPDTEELKALIDEYVKEEIAVREAMAMGLDRDDTVIRRRLRQKLEFLADETAPPSDQEIQDWLKTHPGFFVNEPKVSFEQVYFSPERRGPKARADAERALVKLKSGVKPDQLGDTSMLPSEQPLDSLRETARAFGEEFANSVGRMEPGRWSGPVESSFGWHLVLIREKQVTTEAAAKQVRPLVERELLNEKRTQGLQALYEKLLQKYAVKIERPAAIPPGARR